MEGLIIVLFLCIMAILLRQGARRAEEMDRIAGRLRQLSDDLKQLKESGTAPRSEMPQERPAQPRPAPRPQTPWPQTPPPPPKPVPQPAPPPPQPSSTYPVPPAPGSVLDRIKREHPDLEKFIGENLVNKIGIAILVLGIAFFVKYAIDQHWINEAGRVAIGFGCGAGLLGIAHYLRRSYRAFSAVLAGGGIAVLYSTVAFAYHQYQLFSQPLAFALMLLVTVGAVLLALLYDSLALAVIATVGGFATPLLVDNGSGNYTALFLYLGILNAGILGVAFFRRWPLLQGLAFGCTALLTAGWLLRVNGYIGGALRPLNYGRALALVTLQYALFLASSLAFPLRFRRPFRAWDLTLLLLLTAAYYAAGMLLLDDVQGGRYHGLFTIASGVIDLALAVYCFRRRGTDRNLLYVLIGLALTFATLAVPVQVEGHAITLFWSAEFVLLYWLFLRSRIGLFRLGSWLLMGLATLSLLLDWLYCPPTDGGLIVLFNNGRGGVTNAVVIAAFGAYYALLYRPGNPESQPARRALAWISGSAALLLLYVSLLSAVNLYFYKYGSLDVPNVYHRIVTAALALATGLLLLRRRGVAAPWIALGLGGFALLYYGCSQGALAGLRQGVLQGRYSWSHVAANAVATGLYITLLLRLALLAARNEAYASIQRPLAWIFSTAIVLFLSLDAGHWYVLGGSGPSGQRAGQYARAALTILWGLCSFALMWLGMRHRAQVLRVISLSLFLLALLKLFFFDLRAISEGGKIAAFILLGALLLTVSFMYQKLKKILIDDRPV
ncbi:DUF2339 domain-containing protein [Flaviaesturariibacter aridisoli]|uniref:DUF2339 domain-containing protein n=1 Tax=Flaviaesturariibacter aridisoli TaxID=2545761 RepID=A0A4R4DT40_9BACT|nr:DUF2339 domain-containing protein [Flaviaesturariibacter aridisoli]TCZ64709.1 DUF2339 domain-containing protein [Flaviaesturariibacter aridisoli]